MTLLHIQDSSNQIDLSKNIKQDIKDLLYDIKSFKDGIQSFVNDLVNSEFDGIILSDFKNNQNLTLEICLRIRLSFNIIGQKALKSIFIYCERPVSDIIRKQLQQGGNTTATVLLTNGIFPFDNFDLLSFLINNPQNYDILNENNFKSSFLDLLILNRPKDIGNHSLANIWGAYRLAEITGHIDVVQNNPKQIAFRNDLYMMLLKASQPKINTTDIKGKSIESFGKQILLIDDEADKGWYDILKKICKESNFDFVTKEAGESFSSFFEKSITKVKECRNNIPKWDLIFLDLRLDETEDFSDKVYKQVIEYSGAKLLQMIKLENEGIQVIMFTASNKSYSMRELFNLGADGYYVKESPESKHDIEFSTKNFNSLKEQIDECYNYKFLKEFYYSYKILDKKLNQRVSREIQNPLPKIFVDEILSWTKLGIDNLNRNRNLTGIITSFLIFFSVLENLSNRIIDVDHPIKSKGQNGKESFQFRFRNVDQKLREFEEDRNKRGYYIRTNKKLSTTRNIPWIFKILNTFDFITDQKIDMSTVNRLVKKRNDFIHANTTSGNRINISHSELIELFDIVMLGLNNIK